MGQGRVGHQSGTDSLASRTTNDCASGILATRQGAPTMKLVRAAAPAMAPVSLSDVSDVGDVADPSRQRSMVVPDDCAAATPLIGRQAQLRELEEHYRLATAYAVEQGLATAPAALAVR